MFVFVFRDLGISIQICLLDYAKGFGGKYGVMQEVRDKSALSYEQPEVVGTNYQKVKPDAKADIKSLKNRFENVNPQEEARRKAEEIRLQRLNKEKLERELEEVPFSLYKNVNKFMNQAIAITTEEKKSTRNTRAAHST